MNAINYCSTLEQTVSRNDRVLINHCVAVMENPLLYVPEYVELMFPKFLHAFSYLQVRAVVGKVDLLVSSSSYCHLFSLKTEEISKL